MDILGPPPAPEPEPEVIPEPEPDLPTDRGAYPLVRVAPQYPRRAQERGIEGSVVVKFTITRTGGVADIVVVDSTNPLFDRSAIRAVQKYKYQPYVVNGVPIDLPNQQIRLTFELAD